MARLLNVFLATFSITIVCLGQSILSSKPPQAINQIENRVRKAPPAPPRRQNKLKRTQTDLDKSITQLEPQEDVSKEDILREFVEAPDNHNVTLNPREPEAVLDDPLSDENQNVKSESTSDPTPTESLVQGTSENEPIEEPVEDSNQEEVSDLDINGIEENLEEASVQAENTLLNSKRRPSQNEAFRPGMHLFTKNCTMFAEATTSSAAEGRVRLGRKLWVDSHDKDWHKVFKKNGPVYIPADCLQ